MMLYSASTSTQYCDLNEIFVGESCCRHTGCDVEECSREERVSSVRGCLLGSYSGFTELLMIIEERVYGYVGKFYDK